MNIKFSVIQRFLFCVLFGFSVHVFAAKILDTPSKESILKTVGNEKFIVRSIEVMGAKMNDFRMKKIVVYPQIKQSERLKTFLENPTGESDFGQPLWTITPTMLPVTMADCLRADVDDCTGEDRCINSCLVYGPELLSFDQKRGLIYISMVSTDVGTGGGHYFTFVADINKKQLKIIKAFIGPFVGYLSPSGKYLLLKGRNFITIYNTQTREDFSIYKKNDYQEGKERYYSFGHIQWLSDTRFSYHEAEYHYKFQKSYDGISKKEYDIQSRKTLTETVIKPWKREDTSHEESH